MPTCINNGAVGGTGIDRQPRNFGQGRCLALPRNSVNMGTPVRFPMPGRKGVNWVVSPKRKTYEKERSRPPNRTPCQAPPGGRRTTQPGRGSRGAGRGKDPGRSHQARRCPDPQAAEGRKGQAPRRQLAFRAPAAADLDGGHEGRTSSAAADRRARTAPTTVAPRHPVWICPRPNQAARGAAPCTGCSWSERESASSSAYNRL